MTAEHLQVEDDIPSEVQDGFMAGPAWMKVSILKFLHQVSLSSYEEPVSEATVNILSIQEELLSFKESDERDEECDQVFRNSKNESYIIINGDLKKLYAMRPVAVDRMPFAFFATRYYRKRPEQQSIVDPQSNVGRDSGEPVARGGCMAPLFIKLSNGIIMKKRSDGSHLLPLLQPSQCVDNYGERLLFKPWRSVNELIQESSEEEKAQLRQDRLDLFPMSVFPLA